ncbi:EamA domain-containing membrane protein RarD [Mesorhizobium albiziae]|uniref:EamA domain-containing membrane protein RarD n=1 Tax=Neomesorhizobium albiziae TaxID=335020 RepID=A0A1I4E8F8_9HYPH|nr:DMT family transporter [Mesorhizobium albiziae]GLS33850.1 membrane protein [Mesorhizobium albiziae]SFL01210.1 EamA domain-containing membrane protein RarD [Mesorhizobium albiziae]
MTEMGSDHRHLAGVALVTGSTVFFALAGVFTKSTTAGPWTIAGWRGLTGAALIAAYVLWRRRQGAGETTLRLGWRGWLLTVVGAVSSILFIASFKYTYVANVAVIYATVPFIAAAIEWALFRQRPRSRTMATAAISFAGVAIIVSGGLGAVNLFGDLLALAMTAGCALYLVMIRAFRDTPAVWAAAVSALILFAASWFVVDPLAVSANDVVVMCAFGVSFAVAVILWTEGAKLLPAAEAGLLGTAEIPLAALFAWLLLAELPPATSVVGGAIILAAVLVHAGRDIATVRKDATAVG